MANCTVIIALNFSAYLIEFLPLRFLHPFSNEVPRGDYRKIMVKPRNVTHKIIPYNDTDSLDTFILSDLDLMKISPENVDADAPKLESGIPQPPKEKKAVVIEFSLPTSSYATMALRELLGGDEAEAEAGDESDAGKKRSLPVEESSEEGVAQKRSCSHEDLADLSAKVNEDGNNGNGVHVDEVGAADVDPIPVMEV